MKKMTLIIGLKFNMLTVTDQYRDLEKKRTYCKCICDCGNSVVVEKYSLMKGFTTSCGCYKNKIIKEGAHTTHGMTGTKTYNSWYAAKQRCYNVNHMHYKNYGGRGITVCDKWVNNFSAFFEDMGERPEGCTLDRIDNSKSYQPDNCKWSTYKEQANNRGV